MSNSIIKIDNLSKQYRLGEVGTGTLSHDINRWWYKVRGKEDPYLKIGETNDRTQKGSSEYVWALRDVSFEISQGDVLGIIGRNGAGKSTLLKILSRTTTPTTGSVKVKGRVASLLEVGTGFHPELSGRDNIFLNGAILGMTKQEIRGKFDEIVDFAGVDRYIDTPVKRYSSGMYVRLAFAVAAHLDPEILVVDEVLAVGDAEFQRKCLGKLKDVSVNQGRTVLFVSHNMASMTNLCTKGILMNMGRVEFAGNMDKVVNEYINSGNTGVKVYTAEEVDDKPIQILSASIVDSDGVAKLEFASAEPIFIKFTVKNLSKDRDVRYNIALFDVLDRVIMVDSHYVEAHNGYKSFLVSIPGDLLTPTQFKVGLSIDIPSVKLIELMPERFNFEIVNRGSKIGSRGDSDYGFLAPKFNWIER